jgi:hypothetical protein
MKYVNGNPGESLSDLPPLYIISSIILDYLGYTSIITYSLK